MKIKILIFLVSIFSLSQIILVGNVNAVNTVTPTKTITPKISSYQAKIISKDILYKDEFDNSYKIAYKIKYQNIGKNDWENEGLNQVSLNSKYWKKENTSYPIFLNSIVKSNEYTEFKIILIVDKTKNFYKDYLYLSKNGVELSGSGITVDIKLNDIKNILPTEKLIDIAPVEQEYSLNCESASLQMGLSYFGITKTQDALIDEIGFSTKLPAKKIGNRIVWGDPDEGFVGDYNGLYSGYCSNQTGDQTIRTLKCATGWGVNNKPVATTAKKYLKSSYYLNNASVSDLKSELSNGNPIVFWEVQDSKMPEENIDIYIEKTWKKINYTRTHVVLLIGYKNMFDDTIYTFNDPATGGRIYLAEADMKRIWERYNNNITILKK